MSKHLSEPWFSLIYCKKKKYEGRLNKGYFANLKVGDTITFFNDDFDIHREFTVEVKKIKLFKSFEELLQKKLKKCLPSINNINDGIKIYRKYYSKEDEDTYGIIAIKIKVIY